MYRPPFDLLALVLNAPFVVANGALARTRWFAADPHRAALTRLPTIRGATRLRLGVELLEDRAHPSAGIGVVGSNFLVAQDNSVALINSSTGAVVATYPTGVANDGATTGPDGTIYVADYVNNRILHFSAAGTLLSSFGSAQLGQPQGLTFGPDGDLYVTNVNDTVQKFSPTGTFLGTFIGPGHGLDNAKTIVWGPDGNAYVSSFYDSEVLQYNGTTGAYMSTFATGGDGFEDLTFGPDGNMYVASYDNNTVYRFSGTDGSFLGTVAVGGGLFGPYGLRFDAAGHLDVTSRSTGTIRTYDATTDTFLGNLTTGLTNPAYLTNTTSLITSETGTSASLTVALTSQPTATVTITLAPSVTDEGALSQSTLTFTPSDWNVAQTITVTGLDDHIVQGDQSYQITGTATSTDANYNGLNVAPVTVVNTEADVAGFTITPTFQTAAITGPWAQTSKSGAAGYFTVALTSEPLNPVTIQLNSSMAGEGTLSSSSLTFTAADWNVAQTVTVTGLNDGVTVATNYYVNGTASSSDSHYNGLTLTPIYVSNFGTPKATLATAPTGSTSFGFSLPVQPTAPVTVTFVESLPGEASLSQSSLTFSPTNWNVPQNVTVTALDAPLVDGSHSFVITGTLASTEPSYNGVVIDPAYVVDVAGFTVAPTSLATSSTGTTASFAVALTRVPSAPVTVNLTPSVAGPGALSQSSLTFDAGNWNVPQTVTVTGRNDGLYDGQQVYQITGTATSTDPDYNGLAVAPVTVTNQEAVAQPPVANGASYSTNANAALAVAGAGVLGNATDPQALSLTAAVVAGPSHGILTLNANGSFTYTPNVNFYGTDSFTYAANDGLANSNVATVTLTVDPLPPTATNHSYGTSANAALAVAGAGVLTNDTDPQGLALTAAVVAGPSHGTLTLNADGSFAYAPSANFSGTDSFTYAANDGLANSNVATVSITVSAPMLSTNPTPNAPAPVVPAPAVPAPAVPAPAAPAPAVPAPAAPASALPAPAVPAPTPETVVPVPAPALLPEKNSTASGSEPAAPRSVPRAAAVFGAPTPDSTAPSIIDATRFISNAGPADRVPSVASGPQTRVSSGIESSLAFGSASAPEDAAVGAAVAAPPHAASAPSAPLPREAPGVRPDPVVPVAPLATQSAVPPGPVAVAAPAVAPTSEDLPLTDPVFAELDRIADDASADRWDQDLTNTVVVSGAVVAVGSIAMNTRLVYWFLSALLARPVIWRRFDPLDVIYAWERDGANHPNHPRGPEDEESLQSLVQ